MKEKGTTPAEHLETDRSKSHGKRRFPVVGIGASAGGLEATTALLKAVPNNLGMAYVVLPHLDPLRESAFSEILSRITRMPVRDAKDQTSVEPNHVYVIPPNFEMTIVEGVLHLNHTGEPRIVRTTIDTFLRSLAQDLGNYAIGVILSGTASDGTIGLTAIKGEGGITFAQDSSTKYDGMPASAIAAGCVDMVLPPEGIAKELVRIAQHPYVMGATMPMEHDGTSKAAQMSQIFALLRRATRVDFSEYKPPTIGRRVARRMALHKIEHLAEYVELLQRDRLELNSLYQDLLINVTSFFRDPGAFEAIKSVVYPELLKNRDHTFPPIRIWVPGCSTGEETYSHAIALTEYLSEERIETPVQIFSTDLSDIAIQRARSGIYKETIESDLSPVRLRRFFQKVDSGYQISKTIRDLCIFSTQNVFNDPPFSRIDLISCRNVMIYLSQSLQKRVIPVFHYALNHNGFLMIGNTEGLVGPGSELFEIAERKQKIYRKKSVPTPVTLGFSIRMSEPPSLDNNVPDGKAADAARLPADLQRESDRLLLSRYAPPSVVVNDQLEIIQTRGHTGSFLELPTGKISMNVLKMARPGLLYELQNAIEEARNTGVDSVRGSVVIESNGTTKTVTVRVSPFKTPIQDKLSFLVAFEPTDGAAAPVPEEVQQPLSDDEGTNKDKQIAQLKQELAATKEYLQSIIEAMEATNEELQSAYEEIQSGNEELQSTNEELQTSKEELESANEELNTVNEEIQHRNQQLAQLSNDLINIMNSATIPLVMLNSDLSIRRFTPKAEEMFGLTPSDVGRQLVRVNLKLDIPRFETMMLEVMRDGTPRQREFRHGGTWYRLRATPYRTSDNSVEGAVATIFEITDVNREDISRKPNHKKKQQRQT